eukprot:CAMPEP_0174271834 /NCGR_PEP_ID=MMETSP0439-20130205/49211_1 /TAXON_ID=0 /ORGANISM="Stereomyxa ramosa, Strain Chinc5" /LENGTH=97 /DNA_ID=CAMNT_0015362071 /DNA_START=44 /DNA_END=334 /DNA_ORIENTATION=-
MEEKQKVYILSYSNDERKENTSFPLGVFSTLASAEEELTRLCATEDYSSMEPFSQKRLERSLISEIASYKTRITQGPWTGTILKAVGDPDGEDTVFI